MRESNRRDDARITEAIKKVELAIGEVRVVERREHHVVLDRAIVNKDALLRARRAFTRATEFVAGMAAAGGRKAIGDAGTRLRHLEKKLVELERL